MDPAVAWQWAYPAAAAAVIVGLWAARRRLGRGPMVGVLFFAGTLVPALGFFHVLYQRFSFVADHFQYLAGIGLIAVATGAAARLVVPRPAKAGAAVVVAVTLAALTARSARRFASDAAVWQSALALDAANPSANLNYGSDLVQQGQFDAALPPLQRAAATPGMAAQVYANLGVIAEVKAKRRGPDWRQQFGQAAADVGRSVALEPNDARTRFQFGTLLLEFGQLAPAEVELRAAIRLRPDWAGAHDTLGVCLLHAGRPSEATAEFRTAQQLDPGLPLVEHHLAEAAAIRPPP